LFHQAKSVLEKAKQSLETDKANLTAELEQASAARQEVERRRKQSEQQVQELTSRLAETETAKTDASNKAAKLQVIFGIYETVFNFSATEERQLRVHRPTVHFRVA